MEYKCKDCLREISKKEYFNRNNEGICKKCRQRMSQIKYENKKFGTNKKYVPLRLKHSGRTLEKNQKETTIEKDNSLLYSKAIEKKVAQDIENTFQKYNIKINENDLVPFTAFIDMFSALLDVEKGYMSNYLKAEDIFNMLERDYQHAFEDSKTIMEMNERSQMFKCLLDKRRNVKNINIRYSQVSRIIYEILEKIPDIQKKVETAKENLNSVITTQEEHYYKAEMSELIQQEDFCKGAKSTTAGKMIKFDVSVPLFNYGKNRAGIPYDFHRFIYANTQEEAINIVKKFLQDKFSSCTYKDNDFLAVELYDGMPALTKKEVCL